MRSHQVFQGVLLVHYYYIVELTHTEPFVHRCFVCVRFEAIHELYTGPLKKISQKCGAGRIFPSCKCMICSYVRVNR